MFFIFMKILLYIYIDTDIPKKGEKKKKRKEKPVHILFLVGKSYIHIEAWKVKKD